LQTVVPGQQSFFSMDPSPPQNSVGEVRIPAYQDIVLTEQQVEEARREWPEKSENQQIHFMKSRVLVQLRNQVILPDGRRAFGGAQRNQEQIERKKRLDEALVAAAEERQQEIIDAAFAPLAPGNDVMDRHKAAITLAREAREVRRMEMEEDALEGASEEDLARIVAKELAKALRTGQIESLSSLLAAGEITDATVIDG
jgi:hypothetical protein